MNPEQWLRVRDIFDHLSDKSPSHRADYLDMVCEADDALRAEVEALLSAHDELDERPDDPFQIGVDTGPPREIGGYRLGEALGSGGMGAVYEAEHPNYGAVALKLIPGFAVAQDRARRRFEREADILRAHQHPALCTVYDRFVTDAYAGIAMERIDGTDLADEAPASPRRAADIVMQLAAALGPLHERGVVHRDLKPGNVLVTADGAVKLIDFGIAKFADEKLTQTGQVLGTPRYMSPEQWQGAPMDHRTDLWALGCLLYELIADRPAFSGDDLMATAREVIHAPPPPLPAAAAGLSEIVIALLQKTPDDRLPSCQDLVARLQAFHQKESPA